MSPEKGQPKEITWEDVEGIYPSDIDSLEFPGDLLGLCEDERISQMLVQVCQKEGYWDFDVNDLKKKCDLVNDPCLARRFGDFLEKWTENTSEENIRKPRPLLISKYNEKYKKVIINGIDQTYINISDIGFCSLLKAEVPTEDELYEIEEIFINDEKFNERFHPAIYLYGNILFNKENLRKVKLTNKSSQVHSKLLHLRHHVDRWTEETTEKLNQITKRGFPGYFAIIPKTNIRIFSYYQGYEPTDYMLDYMLENFSAYVVIGEGEIEIYTSRGSRLLRRGMKGEEWKRVSV